MSEERARCESIIENVCGKRKKKRKQSKRMKESRKEKSTVYASWQRNLDADDLLYTFPPNLVETINIRTQRSSRE